MDFRRRTRNERIGYAGDGDGNHHYSSADWRLRPGTTRKVEGKITEYRSAGAAGPTTLSPDDLLVNFQTLQCPGCNKNFGCQHRERKDLIVCNASCLMQNPSSSRLKECLVDKALTKQESNEAAPSQDQRERSEKFRVSNGTRSNDELRARISRTKAFDREQQSGGGHEDSTKSLDSVSFAQPVVNRKSAKDRSNDLVFERSFEGHVHSSLLKTDARKSIVRVHHHPVAVPVSFTSGRATSSAKFMNGANKSIRMPEMSPEPTLSKLSKKLGWAELEIGEAIVLEKFRITSRGDFYIQKSDTFKAKTDLCKEIESHMRSRARTRLTNFKRGSLCLAPFGNKFVRAEIFDKNPNEGTLDVFFCDCGNISSFFGYELFEMPRKFESTPRLIAHCRWNITFAQEFHPEIVEGAFPRMVIVKPLCRVADGQYIVKISSCEPNARVIIAGSEGNGPLAKTSEFPSAQSVSIGSSNRHTPSKRPAATSSAGNPRQAAHPASFRTQPVRKKYMLKNLNYSPGIKVNENLKIIFSWGPTRHLIGGENHQAEADKVQQIVEEGVLRCQSLGIEIPAIGEILLGKYTGEYDEIYFRGTVKSLNFVEKTAMLEFVDYGDSAVCPFNQLRIPNAEMMSYPITGVNVTLPAVTSSEPPVGAIDDYVGGFIQMSFVRDKVIKEDVEAYLWVGNSNLTLNALAHKKPPNKSV